MIDLAHGPEGGCEVGRGEEGSRCCPWRNGCTRCSDLAAPLSRGAHPEAHRAVPTALEPAARSQDLNPGRGLRKNALSTVSSSEPRPEAGASGWAVHAWGVAGWRTASCAQLQGPERFRWRARGCPGRGITRGFEPRLLLGYCVVSRGGLPSLGCWKEQD